MRIAFKPAASSAIGGGHVVRSMAIADALARTGASCTFFVDDEAIAAAPLLSRSSHRLVPQAGGMEHGFDWIVVDDYASVRDSETPLRAMARKILVVDDLANRAHDCDLLLDSTPTRQRTDYAGLVSQGTPLLLGSSYAPLRAEFSQKRPAALARRDKTGPAQRLLVSFGLVDPGGITADAVTAIADALPGLAMDVVLSAASASYKKIEAMAQRAPQVALHLDPPSMPDLMSRCDIALGAGGSTAWERACLGLPAIAVILADNQHALAHGLAARGVLVAVEKGPDLWTQVITALKLLCENGPARQAMSIKAALACDGLGANRIALELDPPASKNGLRVRLRPARPDDADRILAWQTTPGARAFSRNPDPPSREEHMLWMARKLQEPRCIFNIVEEDGEASGVLRMDQRLDGSFMVSILVAAQATGRGIGLAALRAGARLLQDHTLWARIDDRNDASLRIFANAGFTAQGGDLHRRG